MGGVRLHAGVRGGADHRREPRRQVRPQAGVPDRGRSVRAGQPRRRPGRVRRRAHHRPGRPGRRGRHHGPAGAGHVPGHLRPGGAGQGVRHLGAMLGFASAIGLVLGGVLTDANLFGWGWRSVFYVNVPVAVAALIAGARLVPETKDPSARRPNLPGALLLAGSLVAIVYPLLEGRQLGWPAWVWPLMMAGVAGLVVLALIEARRSPRSGQDVAPLLRAGLFRVPAFAAGMGVQLAFFAGMQGFFLAFALWLQAGQHFSPLKAGLTAVAFSVGSFIAAPVAVPLAQKAGRRILAGGAVLMVAGIGGVALAAPHVGVNGSPWPIVPGLVVAGAGLALLVIPLVNVVLAAVPAEVAGGASGLFSTAQQLGGALGVALLGTVFFGYLDGHSFEAALVHTAPYAMGAFALCGVLSLLLPRTAVAQDALTDS